MKREGSKEEFITQYYFTDKITVERIHIFRRDPTEEWIHLLTLTCTKRVSFNG
jgi:hypothetical protein